jgi:hypothetical protein
MIPDQLVEFLHGPSFLQVGTRDADLRPLHTCAVGAVVHDDRRTVTVFVPAARAGRALENLRHNGRVALGAGQMSHEAYQLKGTYLSSRPTTDEDIARQEAFRVKLLESARQGYPEEIAKPFALGFAYRPGAAITFRVEAIFRQTPGPGAGEQLA